MSLVTGYLGLFNPNYAATILSGQQESSVIQCGGFVLCGVKIPAAFTGTTLTFEMCDTVGGTYVPVNGVDGSAISYTVAQGNYYAIDPKDFQGINFLKIKSGSAEGADRALVVSMKG